MAKYGEFDEIILGNGWSNTGVLKYIYNTIPGPAAVPQILITKRKFKSIKNLSGSTYKGIEEEILLIRKIGPNEIKEFAERENLLPTESYKMTFSTE